MQKIKWVTLLSSIVLIVSIVLSPIQTNAIVKDDENNIGTNYVSDEVIVKYNDLDEKALEKQGYEIIEVLNDDYALVETSKYSVSKATINLEKMDGIDSVQPNYLYTATDLPDDELNDQLWGLHNTGQQIQYYSGIENIDINLPETYDRIGNAELKDVVVAVIDSGVDVNHPDLSDNVWVNEKELNGVKGKDDDGNGYVDDIYGYDFFNNDGTVYDNKYDDDHGTHVAGTIAAVSNNQIGVTGIAPNVKIMSLKFLGTNGRGSTAGAIRAIEYAKKMGVKISNNSWGGEGNDPALKTAIEQSGMLFIAAAGNDSLNIDKGGAYPAAFNSANILSVTAIDNRGQQASFSNYGKTNTDIAAPGVDILSTTPEGNYEYFDGTSMATPHVTGAAALAMGYNSALINLNPADFIKIIKDSGTTVVGAKDTSSGKMLNAQQLINAVTPVSASSLEEVYETTKVMTGITAPRATVTVKAGTKQLGTATADATGKFNVTLSAKQVANTQLTISFKSGTQTHDVKKKVRKDDIPPQLTQPLLVTNVDKMISGTVNEDATVKLELAGRTLTAKTDASGNFKITTGTLILGQTGTITIEDTAIPANTTVIPFTVIDGVKPVLNKISTIYNTSQIISGDVSEPSNLKIYFSNYNGGYSKEPNINISIKQAGPFTINLGQYLFGYLSNENIKIVLEDEAGNTSVEKIVKVAVDKTAPKLISPKKLELDDREAATIELEFDEQVEFYIYINSKYYKSGNSTSDGKSIIKLPKIEKNSTVSIDYYDYNWNRGQLTTVVTDKTTPVITNIYPIYNTSKAISGVVTEKATVTAKVDGKQVATAKTDASGNFTMTLKTAITAGKNIEFTAVDEAKPKGLVSDVKFQEVMPDTISPEVVEVNVSDAVSTVEGKISEEATITLYKVTNGVVDSKVLAKGKTDATGKFKLTTGKQKEGTIIEYHLLDMGNNKTTGKWTVVDKTLPILKTFSAFSNTTSTFSGEVSEAGTLKIYTYANKKISTTEILTQQVNQAGKFNFSVQQLYFLNRINQEVAVKFIDKAGNESALKVLKVTADKTPPKLIAPTKLVIDDTGATTIEGILNEKGTVKVEKSGQQIVTTAAGFDGAFELTIPQQKANTKLDFIFTDENGNTTKTAVTVVDKTKPTFTSVNELADTQKYIAGVLSEKGTVTATTVVKGKTTTLGSAKTDAEGNFKITLKAALAKDAVVSLTAKDDKALITEQAYTFTVTEDVVAPEVISLAVNNAITSVEGKLSEEAVISITYTKQDGKTVTSKNVKTDIYGSFKALSLAGVVIGSEVTMTITDNKGIITTYTFTAQDSTAPVVTKIAKLTIASKTLTGTVSEAATVQLFKVINGTIGTAPVLSLSVSKAGNFSFDVSRLNLTENQVYAIRTIDTQDNKSISNEIIVLKK